MLLIGQIIYIFIEFQIYSGAIIGAKMRGMIVAATNTGTDHGHLGVKGGSGSDQEVEVEAGKGGVINFFFIIFILIYTIYIPSGLLYIYIFLIIIKYYFTPKL